MVLARIILVLCLIGEELASLLEMPIKFSDDCVSTDSIDTSISLKPGEVHLLGKSKISFCRTG